MAVRKLVIDFMVSLHSHTNSRDDPDNKIKKTTYGRRRASTKLALN